MITGFLGSGKTTFLTKLLELAGWQNTVFIVNEFGETGIDQHLLPEQSGLYLLANGCICCVHGQEMSSTLQLALSRARSCGHRVERVVIETSGMAFPNQIVETFAADAALADICHLAAVLTVLDASQYFDQLSRYADVVEQTAAADVIYVSKTDLPAPSLDRILSVIADINPLCAVLPMERFDELGLAMLDGYMTGGRKLPKAGNIVGRGINGHRRHLETFEIKVPYNVSLDRFSEFTDALTYLLGDRILRAKGFVKLREHDRWAMINVVKKTLYPPIFSDLSLSRKDSRIVFITEDLKRDVVAEFLDVALVPRVREAADV